MTILFLSRLFYPHIGGVEKHVLEISKRLISKGHSVVVVTESHTESLPKTSVIEKISVYRIPYNADDFFKKFRIWSWLWNNRELIQNADVVHCHDVFFWYLPFRFLFSKKPVYTTFHGYEGYPISPKAVFVRRLSEFLSFGNICIGDFIQKWYGTKPTYVSYGGVDLPDKKTVAKANLSAGRKKNSAIFIGRLDEQTGIIAYAEAFKLLKEKLTEFKLVVLGDGKFKKRLEKDIRVLGFVKHNAVDFQKYHFAFVSRYLSILEAMASKRLVIATYDNSVKEDYLKMTPFAKHIVIAKTPSEIAEKVVYFLQHPTYETTIIENAYKWVVRQTWSSVVNTYLQLWKR